MPNASQFQRHHSDCKCVHQSNRALYISHQRAPTASAAQSSAAGSWALVTAKARLSSGCVSGKPAGEGPHRACATAVHQCRLKQVAAYCTAACCCS